MTCKLMSFLIPKKKKKEGEKDETCYGLQYSSDDILPQSNLKKDIVSKLVLPLPEMHAWL